MKRSEKKLLLREIENGPNMKRNGKRNGKKESKEDNRILCLFKT